MAVTQLFCSTSNPANGTAATTANTGLTAISTFTGGSKIWTTGIGINSNTGIAFINAAGTNQARTIAFGTATNVLELTLTLLTPASNPSAATTFTNARNSGGVSFRLQWMPSGALSWLDNAGTGHVILAAGVLSASTNYSLQFNFTVATSTTGVINAQVFNAAGTQMGSSYSFTGNLGTAQLTQFDLDQDAIVGSYGISEFQYDPTTAAGFIPAWSSGLTVTVPTSALVLAAPVPTLSLDCGVTAPVAAEVFAAAIPTLSLDAKVTAPVAAQVLAAVVPAVSLDAKPTAPVGGETFAATVPTVSLGLGVTAPTAALTWAAIVPTFSTAGNQTVTAPTAAFVLGAPSPTLSLDSKVTAPVASVTFAAPAPTLSLGVAPTAPVARMTLTATVPTLSLGLNASVPVGHLVFAATVPIFSASGLLPPGAKWSGTIQPNDYTGIVPGSAYAGGIQPQDWTGKI